MVKIVGKLFLLFIVTSIFSFISVFSATIKLKATSTDGFVLEQVAAGRPFILEVSLEGASNTKKPEIIGIEKFYVGRLDSQKVTVNGQSSIKHTFHVRVDKQGEYGIGPAVLELDGKKIKSNMLDIKVADDQAFKNDDVRANPLEQKVFFELITDKQDVVVGEKINCLLRFYFSEGVKLEGISDVEIKEVRKTKEIGPYGGQKSIGGNIYNYVAYCWEIFPQKAGIITLPAHRAYYGVRVEDDSWAGVISFFGYAYAKKHIFSNAVTIQVRPLPKYDGVVNAIGEFISFDASVDRTVAKQGDGIVYTLELEGSGDLESLEIKELQDMPEYVKYYDSKSYILDNSVKEGMNKKRFEFIVQGLEPGECEIPSQNFTFFDTNMREYKSLKTAPILLKIIKSDTTAYTPSKQMGKKDRPGVTGTGTPEDDIRPIYSHKSFYVNTQKSMPLWVFILLVCFPLVCFGLPRVGKISCKLKERCSPHVIKKYAFTKAIKSLYYAKKNNNFAQIYSIFITLFAERCELQESLVTQDKIIEILQQKGFSQDQINNWEYFVGKISSFVFYEKEKAAKLDTQLFELAIGWVEKFKTKL